MPIIWLWTWFLRRKLDRRSFTSLGFPGAGALLKFARGWMGGALAPAVILGAGLLVGVYEIGAAGGSSPEFARIGVLPLLLMIIGFIAQGSTEELILRGHIQRNILEWKAGKQSWLWILILPSVLFSLGHCMNPSFGLMPLVNTTLVGIFFGALVLANGQLWTACGVHAGWNLGLGVIWSLPVSGLEVDTLLQVRVSETGTAVRLFGDS